MNLLIRSLQLDIEFLNIKKVPLFNRIEFLTQKYITLFRTFVFGFVPGKSFSRVFGKKYFYEDKFGTAFLQSVYIDNAFLSRFIKKNSIIVDIGANIGQFNFFCKNFLHASEVYSFEPLKETFDILKLNAHGINVYNVAISSKKSIRMFISPDTTLTATTVCSGGVTVPSIGLDECETIQKIGSIDLLKIDTEGSEMDVLKTCKHTIKKSRYILIEMSVSRRSLGGAVDVITFLKEVIPGVKLVWVGRPYVSGGNSMDAVDVLFSNKV